MIVGGADADLIGRLKKEKKRLNFFLILILFLAPLQEQGSIFLLMDSVDHALIQTNELQSHHEALNNQPCVLYSALFCVTYCLPMIHRHPKFDPPIRVSQPLRGGRIQKHSARAYC